VVKGIAKGFHTVRVDYPAALGQARPVPSFSTLSQPLGSLDYLLMNSTFFIRSHPLRAGCSVAVACTLRGLMMVPFIRGDRAAAHRCVPTALRRQMRCLSVYPSRSGGCSLCPAPICTSCHQYPVASPGLYEARKMQRNRLQRRSFIYSQRRRVATCFLQSEKLRTTDNLACRTRAGGLRGVSGRQVP
jgi:hypothetical protein